MIERRLPESAGELAQLLGDPSWRDRRQVITTLAAMGVSALAPVTAILTGERKSETELAAAVDVLSMSNAGEAADEAAIALCAHSEPAIICDAAQILGRRRSAQAVDTLAALTTHADDNVAVASIEAIGRIGDSAALPTLIAALESGLFFRQFPAIDALGRIGDVLAIEPLAKLISSSALAAEVVRALGRFGERAALLPIARLLSSPIDAMVRIAASAIDDLYFRYEARYGQTDPLDQTLAPALTPQVVRRVIEALRTADGAELSAIARLLGIAGGEEAISALGNIFEGGAESAAARALKRIGREADDRVLELFRSADGAKRIALLPLLNRSALLPELIGCLSDPDPGLRARACDSLARIGNPSAASAIFPLLEDPSLQVMQAAIGAIQALGGNETASLAFAAARSERANVRRAALGIVSYFLPRGALDAFLPAVRDPDPRVRDAALQGLAGLADPRAMDALFAAAMDEDPRTRASAMRAMAQVEEDLRVPNVLERALRDDDAWVRYYACQSLGRLAVERAVQAMTALLKDEAPHVRLAAIEALSHVDSPLALEALRDAVTSDDPDMKRAALIGLGIRGRKDALPLLIQAASSPDPSTRLIAVSAINDLSVDEAIGALAEAANDPEESVRNASIEFLSQKTGISASKALISLLDRPQVADVALAALARPAEGRIPLLFTALEQSDEERARKIAAAFARMKRPDATHALFHALGVSNVAARRAAAITLSALGTKDAIAALKHTATEDPDPEVRKLCAMLAA